ncbi:YaaA family protein [bacterium]|nr:YaaA family protein [bacterium]
METKSLLKYWDNKIVKILKTIDCDFIVDLLPESYKKMIDFKKLDSKIIEVNFLQEN